MTLAAAAPERYIIDSFDAAAGILRESRAMSTPKGAAHAANIMEALTASPKPMSAYDLLDQLRPTGVAAPLTVYRALDKLIKAGRVHRIESLNAFVACKDGHDHDHGGDRTVGFAICDACGTVDEFVDPQLNARVRADLTARAFVPRTSALEIHGLCADCSPKAQNSRDDTTKA